MRKRVFLLREDEEIQATLERRIRAAGLRRNWSQAEMATRAGVTRKTWVAIKAGDCGVSLGLLVKAMSLMGYAERLGSLLDANPIGADMVMETGRRRISARQDVDDF